MIPESVRDAGSMLVSGLIAGPIGIATNAATLAAEKLTGLDPEKLGDEMLAKIGIHSEAPVKIEVAQEPAKPAPATPAKPEAVSPWSASQLAAYGVTTTNGNLKLGALEGSDVLNSLELDRLAQQATVQYAAIATQTT